MEVMMRLPASSLDSLREIFESSDKGGTFGLNKDEFVSALLRYLPTLETDEARLELAIELIELFMEIDVNGDGTLEWDEFTSYCIEVGMAATRDLKAPLSFQYREDIGFEDSSICKRVAWMKHVPEMNQILILEEESDVLKIYNMQLALIKEVDISPTHEIQCTIIAAEYVKDLNLVILCSSDLEMSFWSCEDYRLLGQFKTRSIRTMHYCESDKLLFTTTDSGLVLIWVLQIKTIKGKCKCLCIPKGNLPGHKAMVMAFAEVPKYRIIATAGMDTDIRFWDLDLLKEKYVLHGHATGVRFIHYSSSHNLLLSAGFEYDILCWEMRTRQIVMRMVGHSAHCIGLKRTFTSGIEQVVSCDAKGIFKVWDLQRTTTGEATCLETFQTRDFGAGFKPRIFESILPMRAILAAGSHLKLFRTVTSGSQEASPSFVKLNRTLHAIYVVRGSHVHVFDVVTGKRKNVFHHISKAEITSFTFDSRERKLILGNANGYIRVCNAITGELMKQAEILGDGMHLSITNLLYCKEDCCLIATTEASIHVFDEDKTRDMAEGRMLPHIRFIVNPHSMSITCSDFSYSLSLIATGSSDYTIRLWDFQFLRLEGVCVGHKAEVVAVSFVNSLPILVSVDCIGVMMVWSVRPMVPVGRQITVTYNRSPVLNKVVASCLELRRSFIAEMEMLNTRSMKIRKRKDGSKTSLINSPVSYEVVPFTSMQCGYTSTGKLIAITGDLRGDLKVWDLQYMVDRSYLKPVPESDRICNSEGYNPLRSVEFDYSVLNEKLDQIPQSFLVHSNGKTHHRDSDVILRQPGMDTQKTRKQEFVGLTFDPSKLSGDENDEVDSKIILNVQQQEQQNGMHMKGILDSLLREVQSPAEKSTAGSSSFEVRQVKREARPNIISQRVSVVLKRTVVDKANIVGLAGCQAVLPSVSAPLSGRSSIPVISHFSVHLDEINAISFCNHSEVVLTGSSDYTAQIHALQGYHDKLRRQCHYDENAEKLIPKQLPEHSPSMLGLIASDEEIQEFVHNSKVLPSVPRWIVEVDVESELNRKREEALSVLSRISEELKNRPRLSRMSSTPELNRLIWGEKRGSTVSDLINEVAQQGKIGSAVVGNSLDDQHVFLTELNSHDTSRKKTPTSPVFQEDILCHQLLQKQAERNALANMSSSSSSSDQANSLSTLNHSNSKLNATESHHQANNNIGTSTLRNYYKNLHSETRRNFHRKVSGDNDTSQASGTCLPVDTTPSSFLAKELKLKKRKTNAQNRQTKKTTVAKLSPVNKTFEDFEGLLEDPKSPTNSKTNRHTMKVTSPNRPRGLSDRKTWSNVSEPLHRESPSKRMSLLASKGKEFLDYLDSVITQGVNEENKRQKNSVFSFGGDMVSRVESETAVDSLDVEALRISGGTVSVVGDKNEDGFDETVAKNENGTFVERTETPSTPNSLLPATPTQSRRKRRERGGRRGIGIGDISEEEQKTVSQHPNALSRTRDRAASKAFFEKSVRAFTEKMEVEEKEALKAEQETPKTDGIKTAKQIRAAAKSRLFAKSKRSKSTGNESDVPKRMSRVSMASLKRRSTAASTAAPKKNVNTVRVGKLRVGRFLKKDIMAIKINFERMDEDNGGTVDMVELMNNLDKLSYLSNDIAGIFETIDQDHSGEVTFKEMLKAFMPGCTTEELKAMLEYANAPRVRQTVKRTATTEEEKEELREMFALYDTDGNGTVSIEELFEAMNHKSYEKHRSEDDSLIDAEYIGEMMRRYDGDTSEGLTADQFIKLMTDMLNNEEEEM